MRWPCEDLKAFLPLQLHLKHWYLIWIVSAIRFHIVSHCGLLLPSTPARSPLHLPSTTFVFCLRNPAGGFWLFSMGGICLSFMTTPHRVFINPSRIIIDRIHRQTMLCFHAVYQCYILYYIYYICYALKLIYYRLSLHCVLVYALLTYVLCCCHFLASNKILLILKTSYWNVA